MKLGLKHSWAQLPPLMHTAVAPLPVANPHCLMFNQALATELGLDAKAVEAQAALLFSGNALPDDAQPLAMAYAGHQFGGFSPRLGDGRAHLLGELIDSQGKRHDLHLKGSGRTPYSRGGDGRAAVGPMLREYLISEAMHALDLPTTRSLAVIGTGEPVLREDGALPGAILVRTAASHLRVGSFQYPGSRGDIDTLRALLDYTLARHYPDAATAAVPALALLQAVAEQQALLIANWLRVGFVHGVMNTDNMALSGETIDYGPCAFLDEYDANKVFSSIDHQGRYAFANQPLLAQWNLARLAEALLPLIHTDADTAIQQAVATLEPFPARVQSHYAQHLRAKLGLPDAGQGADAVAQNLLQLMQHCGADYTLTFRALADVADDGSDVAQRQATGAATLQQQMATDPSGLQQWLQQWRAQLDAAPAGPGERSRAMRRVSPAYIARNHLVEAALASASTDTDMAPFKALLQVVQHPYDEQPGQEAFALPPLPAQRVTRTFCGT